MRYSLDERRQDRATGRQIEGGPAEITEYWTFRRASGGQWLLSAIQQTD
jgi:predicted lipid-binding transport protein (Tim44 family)